MLAVEAVEDCIRTVRMVPSGCGVANGGIEDGEGGKFEGTSAMMFGYQEP